MNHPNFVILYVDQPEASGRFYADLLGASPIESSPTFVLFMLDTGLMLGLWSRHTVEPSPGAPAGGGEIVLRMESYDAVDARCADWTARGIPLLMPPATLEFGRSFVARDPDGHRLRVFAPEAAR